MIYYDYVLADELISDEGFETVSYKDTKNNWTIGIGHLLGRGPEFSNIVWTPRQVIITFMQDLNESVFHVKKQIIPFDSLSIERQRVLINMMFNLGPYKFSRFVKMTEAINNYRFDVAYAEMLDSDWARDDVPARANRLAERWRNG